MASNNPEHARRAVMHELIRSAAVLESFRCFPATDGNLSARLDADTVLITKSGIEKRGLTASSFVEVQLNATNPAGASSEWPMHRAIYKARSDVTCVLHTHPPFLSSFATTDRIPDARLLAETGRLIGRIVRVPFVEPGSEALGKALLNASAVAAVYLLSNHGALSVGTSISEALHRMERAEFLAQVAFQAACLSGEKPIPENVLREPSR